MRKGEKERLFNNLQAKVEKELENPNVVDEPVDESVLPLNEQIEARVAAQKQEVIPAGIIPGRPGADTSKYNKDDVKKAWHDERIRDADYADIAGMYLRGMGVYQIAKVMTANRPYVLTWQRVAQVLKELHQQWQDSQLIDLDMAKARELQRIDELEVTYWRAWERSTKKVVETEIESTNDTWGNRGSGALAANGTLPPKKGEVPYKREKQRRTEKERDGAVEFLRGVQWCIDERCKILGLNAPATIEVKDWRKEAEKAGLNPSEEFDKIVGKAVEKLSREKERSSVDELVEKADEEE